MFADTHCHIRTMETKGINPEKFFTYLQERGTSFLLDIGTMCDDIDNRLQLKEIANRICGNSAFLHFSAGIWPDDEAILNRIDHTSVLSSTISRVNSIEPKTICALGECGLDRNWNTQDKGTSFLSTEEELFELQLELATQFSLPVIIHSRDAFDETYSIMKNAGDRNAVIHCFSYGIPEARAFLDLGYYISFSGSITFGKGEKLERSKELLRYIPHERLLLETDAPYMAPVPHRSEVNTPILIEHTYRFVSEAIGLNLSSLSELIQKNAESLFM